MDILIYGTTLSHTRMLMELPGPLYEKFERAPLSKSLLSNGPHFRIVNALRLQLILLERLRVCLLVCVLVSLSARSENAQGARGIAAAPPVVCGDPFLPNAGRAIVLPATHNIIVRLFHSSII